jgi:hypothetical protein
MLPAHKPAWLPLGALLVREGLITNEQLELALIDQQGTGLRLGELLVQWGWVDSTAISRALAEQYDLEFVDLDSTEVEPAAVERLAAAEARNRGAIPIRMLEGDRLSASQTRPMSAPATSCAPCSVGRSRWSWSTRSTTARWPASTARCTRDRADTVSWCLSYSALSIWARCSFPE